MCKFREQLVKFGSTATKIGTRDKFESNVQFISIEI